MTNRERLNSLTDEDYAHWLCHQLWEDYDADDVINVIRYNQVRNFLKMEYKENDKSKGLPSAQPEQQHGRIFQEIVVEYPSISTYPEYKGKPYFSIKYTENGQEFIGYGTYKPEVLSEYLKEYFMPSAQPEQRWIPCSERLPEVPDVLCCDVRGEMCIAYPYADKESNTGYSAESDSVYMIDCIAWMPLPEPYQEGKNE